MMRYNPDLQCALADEHQNHQIPLSELPAGKSGIVTHLNGDKDFINRVASLGFTMGGKVAVLHNQNQGPMIVSILSSHIALGRHEANLIQVQPL